MHKWTEAELGFLRSFAPGHSYRETTAAINESFSLELKVKQVKNCLNRRKIKTGRTGRFEKGNVPVNKGTHSGGWEPTQFKKGHVSCRRKPVGTVIVRKGPKKRQYVYEKTGEPDIWKRKSVLEWERHYGSVPEGKIIIFADGNSLNTSVENLVAVTRAQHAVMNRFGVHGYDRESAEAAANVAALRLRAMERKRENRK